MYGDVGIVKNFNGIMLKPAILRCDLSMRNDFLVDEFAIGGENGELGGSGGLIDGGDVLGRKGGLDESLNEG